MRARTREACMSTILPPDVYARQWRDRTDAYRRHYKAYSKKYLNTITGRLANKAGFINTRVKRGGYVGKVSGRDLLHVWHMQGGACSHDHITTEPKCVACSEHLDTMGNRGMFVDHTVPLRSGGSNSRDNLQLMCEACHGRKTSGDITNTRRHPGLQVAPVDSVQMSLL